MSRNSTWGIDITPSARRLTSSLRDIGYEFPTALADIVDNSIAADASRVDIEFVADGANSHIIIADDGFGMTERGLDEALRFGSRRDYKFGDLGRYGLGLKTASISQCRRVTVVTRRSTSYRRLATRTLDLDHIEKNDRWEIFVPRDEGPLQKSLEWLTDRPGTVVIWENLDRVLPVGRPDAGISKRRLRQLAVRTNDYLGLVFHRYLAGEVQRLTPLSITVNGEKVRPWDPFASLEEHREELPRQSFEVSVDKAYGQVLLRRFVLPPRSRFSSLNEFERMSGPKKWNRQQGLYIYRADRLIQHGGWAGIRAADEHTKFARASIDFQTDLDLIFQINVAKMRVSLPAEVRTLIEQPIHELCHRADSVYRRDSRTGNSKPTTAVHGGRNSDRYVNEIGSSIIAAALEAGEREPLLRIMGKLRELDPGITSQLGW